MSYPIRDNSLNIQIEIFGVTADLKREVTGLIDTGFSGYLSLPFVIAFPLGLILKGQQPYTLADGSVSNHFVCLGTVTFAGQSAVIPIDVQPSGPVLIGNQLLKKLNLTLNVEYSRDRFDLQKS